MKKSNKLQIKKITLRTLDEPELNAIAGGVTGPDSRCTSELCPTIRFPTCPNQHTCVGC